MGVIRFRAQLQRRGPAAAVVLDETQVAAVGETGLARAGGCSSVLAATEQDLGKLAAQVPARDRHGRPGPGTSEREAAGPQL